jgi:hypothetical protein
MFFLLYATGVDSITFDIYHPIGKGQIHISDDQIAVVDSRYSQVYVYDKKDGSLKFTFGQKGQGPGDFDHPRSIALIEGVYVVQEKHHYSKFSLSGDFISKNKLPNGFFSEIIYTPFSIITQSENIWVEQDDIRVIGHKENLEKEILSLPYTGQRIKEDMKKMIFKINPTDQYYKIISSPNRRYVYYCDYDDLRIFQIDSKTLEIVNHFEKEVSKVPIDQDWAETWFLEQKQMLEEKNPNNPLTSVSDIPSHWPVVAYFRMGSDGLIYAFLNTGKTQTGKVLAFDQNLNPKTPLFTTREALFRTVHIEKDSAYILTFADETAGVLKIKHEDINNVEKYPHHYH